jgi:hypothetical protein
MIDMYMIILLESALKRHRSEPDAGLVFISSVIKAGIKGITNANLEANALFSASNDATQTQSRPCIAESQQCSESGILKTKISFLQPVMLLLAVREYFKFRLFKPLPRRTSKAHAMKANTIAYRKATPARFSIDSLLMLK